MKLSVIIVNYNVRYFLEQCLHSVFQSSQGIDTEVFVVDNNSVDGSVGMIREKFPGVILLCNDENLGFSRANNMAIRQARGEYILLLNPDTVVEKDTFSSVIRFMDAHPDAGGAGVKMIDGKGHFLPESKRGLPTPLVAFYKVFGLSALFPRSRIFGRYHLGFLSPDEIHSVDILSGAFMFLRKSCLDQTGMLDESFFMYGEDIDLSYRILQAGYKNYYFPDTRIIHYKGESTKKSSVNYVFTFYRAMIIFARKHFSHQNARIFSILIHLAIYLRAFAAMSSRFMKSMMLPLIDGLMLFGGMYFIKNWWEGMLFPWGGRYPWEFIHIAVPLYILTWLFSIFLVSGYDRPVRTLKIVEGYAIGTLVILVIYSLLDESYRFSRAMIFFGLLWGLFASILLRLVLHYVLRIKYYQLGTPVKKRFIVVGEREEAGRVAGLVREANLNPAFIGLVGIDATPEGDERYIGTLRQIRDIIEIYTIEEVIFCAKDVPAHRIIDVMSEQQDLTVEFKIAPPASMSLIGSKSISTMEDLYIIDIDSINKKENRRNKFLLDTFMALFLLVFSPILVFITRQPAGLYRNILQVIGGKRSWVGYGKSGDQSAGRLPGIRPGILTPVELLSDRTMEPETIHRLNMLYARDYDISTDLNIIFRNIRELGRKS